MCTVAPCVWLLFSDLGEVGVELGAFFVVVFDALAPMGAEAVLIQRVDVDWGSEAMDATEVYKSLYKSLSSTVTGIQQSLPVP